MGDISIDAPSSNRPLSEQRNHYFQEAYGHRAAGEEPAPFKNFLPRTPGLGLDRTEDSGRQTEPLNTKNTVPAGNQAYGEATTESGYDCTRAPSIGLAARFAYYSLTGKLDFDKQAIENKLARGGLVAEQVLERMKRLESLGWTFTPLNFNDPVLKLHHTNPFKRLMAWASIGGYNNSSERRITYGNPLTSVSSVLGRTYGSGDPLKEVTTVMAHEVSHADGIICGHNNDYLPEQKIYARRLLATETRAILTQLHVGQTIGASELTLDLMHEALRRKDLGGFIYDNWRYEQFKSIDRSQAVSFVNDYIDRSFGSDLVDSGSGKVRAFNIDAGLSEQIGTTSRDHLRVEPSPRENGSQVSAPEVTRSGFLRRWTRNICALGTLCMVSDLKGAFQESPSHGLARSGRIATDWAGFEAGNFVGAQAGKFAIRFLAPRVARSLLPVAAIGTGCYLSERADLFLGKEFESTVSEILSHQKRPSR